MPKKTLTTIVLFNSNKNSVLLKKNINVFNKMNPNENSFLFVSNREETTSEQIRQFCKTKNNFYFIQNKVNIGPGSAFNQALKFAIAHDFDYLYFVDEDSETSTAGIKNIQDVSKRISFSFLASKVISDEKNHILYYFRNKFDKAMNLYSIRNYNSDIQEINAAGYSGLFINCKIVEEFRIYINEKMFIDFDDYDFTYRLSLIAPGYLVTKSVITHPDKYKKSLNFNRFQEFIRNYLIIIMGAKKKASKRNLSSSRNYISIVKNYGQGAQAKFKLFLAQFTKSIND